MKRLVFCGVLLLAAGNLRSARAQDKSAAPAAGPNVKPQEYDVVSIRPNKSDSGQFKLSIGHDRFSAENVTLQQMLTMAYSLRPELISGITGVMSSARFDVEAKVMGTNAQTPAKLSDSELERMLVPVLERRFGLKTHFETKVQPVFELVVTKGGAKLGPTAVDAQDGNYRESWTNDKREFIATRINLENLATFLSDKVQRTVIDKTGLEGRYSFDLKWSSDDGPGGQADAGPSIYTVLEEQLGLKLQSAKAPVKSLMVDHAQMPSEN